MKTIKKLSIALLLSISSLQMINTMEGPVEGPKGVGEASRSGQPTVEPVPEAIEEENDGEKDAEKSAGSSGISEAEKNADKSADEKGDEKGSSTTVTDDNGGGSEKGGLSVDGDSSASSEKQVQGNPKAVAKRLGITSEQAEKLMSGEDIATQSKKFSDRVKDFFKKIGKGIASPFKALGKLLSDGFNRMKRLVSRNNSKLPEAEQVSPATVNATAESLNIANAVRARLESGNPMTAEEAENMKQTFKDSIGKNTGISSSDLGELEKMIDVQVDALQTKLEEQAKSAARKKNLLDGLTGEDSSDLFDGPDQPLTSRGSSVFEEGEDKNPTAVEKSTPNNDLFEGAGEDEATTTTTTTTTSRQMSPEEEELYKRKEAINSLASKYESLSPDRQEALIKSLQSSANTEFESKKAQLAEEAGKRSATSKMAKAARKELVKNYREALEGTGLTMNRNGKIIRSS